MRNECNYTRDLGNMRKSFHATFCNRPIRGSKFLNGEPFWSFGLFQG